MEEWPARQHHVVLFITHCFESGLSPNSIATYIAGISYFHKLNNWGKLSDMFVVAKMLEGCHRLRQVKDLRAPITQPVLAAICEALNSVCSNEFETLLFSSLYTLAYFGLFRVSELVSPSRSQIGSPLQQSDVKYNSDKHSLVITLRATKTNQRAIPIQIKLPEENNAYNLCPVRAIQNYLTVRPLTGGPFFCHVDGSPVTRYQFSAVLNKSLRLTKFDLGHFKTHSFRIGRASDLAAQGIPSNAIMKMGRWQSACYKLYVR